MKAASTTEARSRSSSVLGVKRDANCSIMKTAKASIDFQGEKFSISEEMKECFLKLSDLVPDVPRNEAGNIDGTVLMQYVIDYILDLELQLDTSVLTTDQSSPSSSPYPGKVLPDSTSASSSPRAPLSEITSENLMPWPGHPTTSLALDDDIVLPDCDIRPPSK